MRCGRNLEQTPSLVDADIADDIGSNLTTISVSADANRVKTRAQVEQVGAVEHETFVNANGTRHAVAELRGVLDVVDAGDGVVAAEQERGVVARIAMPRRCIGRG